jgi:hypothetical protein
MDHNLNTGFRIPSVRSVLTVGALWLLFLGTAAAVSVSGAPSMGDGVSRALASAAALGGAGYFAWLVFGLSGTSGEGVRYLEDMVNRRHLSAREQRRGQSRAA